MSKEYFLAQFGHDDHISHIMDSDDDEQKIHALESNPTISNDNMYKSIYSKNSDVLKAALASPSATPNHLEIGVHSPHWAVRSITARNPNLSSDQHGALISDEHSQVRHSALQNTKTTKEHLTKSLDDDVGFIRQSAKTKLKDLETA